MSRNTRKHIAPTELAKKGIITGSEAMLKSSNRESLKKYFMGTMQVPSNVKAGSMGFGWQ